MALVLAIETALDACSVAIGQDGNTIILKEEIGNNLHASHLGLLMQAAFKESGIGPEQLEAVCVSKGPGSYTGLRIGVSAAKGICYAQNIPLYAVTTTQAMAYGARLKQSEPGIWYCPMIDARRMEIYFALYDEQLQEQQAVQAAIIAPELFSEVLQKRKILFFGNGMPKSRETYESEPNALFLEGLTPSAAYLLPLAEEKIQRGEAEDVFRFEPFYLKDFIAKDPGAKIARVLRGES